MTRNVLDFFKKNEVPFCGVVCVIGLLREVCTKEESIFALDMREYVQH